MTDYEALPRHVITSGGWKRASGPFWEAQDPQSADGAVQFADRGGRPQLVAVYNPAKNDFRVKCFVTAKQTDQTSLSLTVDGHNFDFVLPSDPWSCHCESDRLWRMLQGMPPVEANTDRQEDEDPTVHKFLDANIEARFTSDRKWRHHWAGEILRAPEWMQAKNIGVSEPETSGGWHGLILEVGCDLRSVPHSVRVNGHWCSWMPQGHTLLLLSADPLDIEEIRNFGEAGSRAEPEVEHVPVRDRQTLHKLYRAVRMDADFCRRWAKAVQTLRNKHWGMCAQAGQQDFYRRAVRRLEAESVRKQGYLQARYKRRASAYHDYDIGAWASEVRGKPLEWLNRISEISTTYLPRCTNRYDNFQETIDKMRAEANEAEALIDELNEKYEGAIRYLYLPK